MQTDGGDKVSIRMPKFGRKQWYAIIIGTLFLGSSAAYALFLGPNDSLQDNSNIPEHVSDTDSVLAYPGVGVLGGIHEHFTISVTLDGVPVDFSRARYQLRDQRFHFESGDGSLAHMHAAGINLDYVFRTLGMQFNSTCIVLETGRAFCNDEAAGKSVQMFVDGRVNTEFEKYYPKASGTDESRASTMDSIVITYG